MSDMLFFVIWEHQNVVHVTKGEGQVIKDLFIVPLRALTCILEAEVHSEEHEGALISVYRGLFHIILMKGDLDSYTLYLDIVNGGENKQKSIISYHKKTTLQLHLN